MLVPSPRPARGHGAIVNCQWRWGFKFKPKFRARAVDLPLASLGWPCFASGGPGPGHAGHGHTEASTRANAASASSSPPPGRGDRDPDRGRPAGLPEATEGRGSARGLRFFLEASASLSGPAHWHPNPRESARDRSADSESPAGCCLTLESESGASLRPNTNLKRWRFRLGAP